MKRRNFLTLLGLNCVGASVLPGCRTDSPGGGADALVPDGNAPDGNVLDGDTPDATVLPPTRPNIILLMADDLGWGDTGFNGNSAILTPHLDAMAAGGIQFSRFYAGAPVCSPTRGSAITGRHPFRYGVFYANEGHLKDEELTLAEALQTLGYNTGHFGKWHLGTLTTEILDSNRGGPGSEDEYSPPWDNGFDVCFSTEAKVPTWDPMVDPVTSEEFGTRYWVGPGQYETENLEGDDSRVIMDRVLPFVEQNLDDSTPFLAVVWFHTPHKPVVAGPEHRAIYAAFSEDEQHYYGCITAMDEQIGRLRDTLSQNSAAQDTLLLFCSDNGPEGDGLTDRTRGSTGPFRGRKRSLLEGGIRVPGVVEWPGHIAQGRIEDTACTTSDFMPTILALLGSEIPDQPLPVDGINILPIIEGQVDQRAVPIAFESDNAKALIDGAYKILTEDGGATFVLYDLVNDPGETTDLANDLPAVVDAMREVLQTWEASCDASLIGADYL